MKPRFHNWCGTAMVLRKSSWKDAHVLYCPKCRMEIYPGAESMFSHEADPFEGNLIR